MQILKKHPYWLISLIVILLYTVYQAFIITDRYVSTAYVVLDSPTIGAPTLDFGSILSGTSGSGDLLLLREHMLSVDMLNKLDKLLDLRSHFSATEIDYFSRLSDAALPMEEFHNYYLSRVDIELDEYSKVLRIRAQAFSPEVANKIIQVLLDKGEAHMNEMGQRLAAEQVKFIEKQVELLAVRLSKAREALLSYQNQHGLVSPRVTVENLSSIVGSLEAELAHLKAQQRALRTSRSTSSPEVLKLRADISALEQQIELEQNRMATKAGDALNRVTLEYETLELEAQFTQELYSSALAALENVRVEAVRQLKQVSVLQEPTLPEYSTQPQKLYNITAFTIVVILLTVIIHMLTLVISDHRD